MLDIDREYNLWQNNLNNRLTNNNRRKYNNIKIDSYSGYSTDDTTNDNKYSLFYNQQNQHNKNFRQKQNEMRKNTEQYIDDRLKKFEQDIGSWLQKHNNLYPKDNWNSFVDDNLRSNMYTNINNNKIRRYDDRNNRFTSPNNQLSDIKGRNNNNKNAKFNPNCIWSDKYKDLVQAIRKYNKIIPNAIKDHNEKQFAQVLKDEEVNSNHYGWWYDIDATKFKKIKETYDKIKKGYDELPNKKVENKTNNRQYKIKATTYAEHEVPGFHGDVIDYYLDHRRDKQDCDHAVNEQRAERYRMGTNNINGLYNRFMD